MSESIFMDESGVEENEPALGQTVRTLREQQGLTPQALADRANIELQRLERIEAGKGGDYQTVRQLSRALDVTLEEFTRLHEEFVRKEEDAS